MKKKVVWVVSVVLLISIISGGFAYFLYQENIKRKYSQYASILKGKKIYNEKKEMIGTVHTNFSVELQKNKKNKKYFKIKGTNYYVYYKDIKKEKKLKTDSLKENQLSLEKGIKSSKKIILYQDNQKVLTLSKIEFPIAYENKDSYFIFFQNTLLEVKKEEKIQEYEIQNDKEKKAKYISVLYYERVLDSCSDSNCITTTNFKNQIDELLKNEYYFISRDDFEKYMDGYIQLKEKAIYLTTSNLNGAIDTITKDYNIPISDVNAEYDIHYYSTNKPSNYNTDKKYANRYQIKQNTTLETVLKMANGETIEIIQDRQSIPVLNYHFFYDPNGKDYLDTSRNETCDEEICLDIAKFREHLDYLKENHFQILTMEEFKKWMYGEIELPTKSILITVDDGARGTGKHNGNKLIPVLEEYKVHATLFLITGWWSYENYLSPYLTIQSHTNDMHQYGSCGRGQINCATYNEAMQDLKNSLNFVTNNDSFCFPFYMYNQTSLQAVKDTGFKLAFVGGNRKATRQDNKFLLPRYPIVKNITMDYFKRIVN